MNYKTNKQTKKQTVSTTKNIFIFYLFSLFSSHSSRLFLVDRRAEKKTGSQQGWWVRFDRIFSEKTRGVRIMPLYTNFSYLGDDETSFCFGSASALLLLTSSLVGSLGSVLLPLYSLFISWFSNSSLSFHLHLHPPLLSHGERELREIEMKIFSRTLFCFFLVY